MEKNKVNISAIVLNLLVGLFGILLSPEILAVNKSQNLIAVPVAFVEALKSSDSSSSLRYKELYEFVAAYAIGRNERRLNACGYQFESIFEYFEDSDALSAREVVDGLQPMGTWILFGPRKSNHFLLTTKASFKVPQVSPLANALSVTSMGPPFFTMSHSLKEFSDEVLRVLKASQYPTTYGAIVDGSCSFCKDGEREFKKVASSKYKRAFRIDVSKAKLDASLILSALEKNPVGFLLLPNYSDLTAKIIKVVQKKFPSVRFVGFDGWGTNHFGFLNKHELLSTVRGFSVRTGTSPKQVMEDKNLNSIIRVWNHQKISPSSSHLMIVEFLDRLTDLVCRKKPKNRKDFLKIAHSLPSDYFRSEMGISTFKLRGTHFFHAE